MAPPCPTCQDPLSDEGAVLTCVQGHVFTPPGLVVTSNLAAVKALWQAIRSLEDDAAGLDWALARGDASPAQQAEYARQAAEGRQAADVLRALAVAAQARLDALPGAPSAMPADGAG